MRTEAIIAIENRVKRLTLPFHLYFENKWSVSILFGLWLYFKYACFCDTIALVYFHCFLMQALQAYYRGDLHEARRKNTISKRFTIASAVLGIVLIIACLALLVVEYLAITNFLDNAGQVNALDPIPIS